METLSLLLSLGTPYGTDTGEGTMRYTSNTNGGPVFVYVKDGKILRHIALTLPPESDQAIYRKMG